MFTGASSQGCVVFIEKYVWVLSRPGIDIIESEVVYVLQDLSQVGTDFVLSNQNFLTSH